MAKTQTTSKRTPAKRNTQRRNKSSRTKAKSSAKAKTQVNGSMLEDYFVHALKDIYWAEKALTKALPKMAKNATSAELKKAFKDHLEVTKKQIARLDQVFNKLGHKAQGKKCDAMEGLIEESESIIKDTKDDTSTRDAALIISAQKVEHYEIASYGGLVQLAKTMNKKEIAKLLETTLAEEKETDVRLTKIAENSGVNEQASEEPAEKTTLKENIMSIFS